MSDVRETTATLLVDRPDLREDLQTILTIDEANETWTFEDIPIDSGVFGELVSQGIIEKSDGQYRVTDPAAVENALRGETPHSNEAPERSPVTAFTNQLRTVDPVFLSTLLAVLGLVFLMRTVFAWPAVFQGEHIVLAGNDPYYYRYILEEHLRTGTVIGAHTDNEVLLIGLLSQAASLLGGGTKAVGLVLAWYPVVTATLAGGLAYVIAVSVFDDRRVGLSSLAFYAVTPIIAYRAALGFGDHHALDYFLVAVIITGLVLAITEQTPWNHLSSRRLIGTGMLSIGVAAVVHAWRGGVLLILPLAAFAIFNAASATRTKTPPLQANAWVLTALGVAAVIAVLPHELWNWTRAYRVYTPALLFAFSTLATLIAEFATRSGLSPPSVFGVTLTTSTGVSVLAWWQIQEIQRVLTEGLGFISSTNQTTITETASLFNPELGLITAPIFYFGFAFFFGIASLAWAAWRTTREHRPAWLALTIFGVSYLAASAVQVRFAGQFGVILAVFSGLGFVHLIAAVDAARPPNTLTQQESNSHHQRDQATQKTALQLPNRESATAIALLFLLVAGLGVPQTMGGINDSTVDQATFDASLAIDEHATAANLTWRENYVFSPWSWNRVYNYFVSGQSASYGYASSHYADFVTANNGSQWYQTLTDRPVGYVVINRDTTQVSDAALQTRLWEQWGGANGDIPGLAHYQAVYANEKRVVFDLVPGAILVSRGTPNETHTVTTTVTAGEKTKTFQRRATATQNGWYAVRVPYSGTYETTNGPVTVPDQAVSTGAFSGNASGPTAVWRLNAGTGEVAFDSQGSYHGRIENAAWTAQGTAVSFDGDGTITVPDAQPLGSTREFAVTATFHTANGTDYVNQQEFPRLVGTAAPSSFADTSGMQIALAGGRLLAAIGSGSDALVLKGPRVDDGQNHTVELLREGEQVQLLLDGETVSEGTYSGRIEPTDAFSIGSTANGAHGFTGTIHSVTVTEE